MDRGAFIVFEGCDKVGKSTQCQRLVAAMTRDDFKVQSLKFPDRTTAIGKAIDEYLNNKVELEDHAIHLLFSANRWESIPMIKQLLLSGTSLVVDRYAFSGVAFTAAKMSCTYCCAPVSVKIFASSGESTVTSDAAGFPRSQSCTRYQLDVTVKDQH
eukprot:Em0021g951a